MIILDGKLVASTMYEKLHGEVTSLKNKSVHPKLVIIQVGNDPASLSYIKSKAKASEKVGIECVFRKFEENEIDTEGLIALIEELNRDPSVHGILVQLPLPKHIYEPDVIRAINPQKDVDGFTAYNIGKMFLSKDFEHLAPCTPLGIIRLLEFYEVALEGKEVCVIGRSNIVGKPVAVMLINRNATVTVCHSRTKNLAEHTRRADILIVAVGKAGFVTADMVKEGAIVVDVGINRNAEGKLVGDADFDSIADKCSMISPVPGGCGLMTVACLMENTVKAAKRLNNIP